MTTGLREAHAHLPSLGRSLSMLDLSSCTGLDECLDLLGRERRALDARGPGTPAWVLAFGARVEAWPERRWPTRRELDRAAGIRPCAVMSFDHHAVCAGTRAMELAGLHSGATVPAGGVVCRDPRTDEPTGLLLEAAAYRVWNAQPEPTNDERVAHVRAALGTLNRLGFVEVHDLLSPAWLGPVLAGLHDRGELRTIVHLFPPIAEIEVQAEESHAWRRDGLSLAGGKIFVDGTLNSRTAWTLHPYADPLPGMSNGQPLMSADQVRAAAERAQRLGLILAAHAIGDGAVRAALDGIAGVASRPSSSLRHRIEHAELIDERDVPRFASMGVIASVQPCHLLTDIEVLRRALPDRLGRVLPLRELVDAGCAPGDLLFFGSDVPIVRADPIDSVQAAVHRRRDGMDVRDSIAPGQALTVKECWAAFGR